jgi:hypothetical protein
MLRETQQLIKDDNVEKDKNKSLTHELHHQRENKLKRSIDKKAQIAVDTTSKKAASNKEGNLR